MKKNVVELMIERWAAKIKVLCEEEAWDRKTFIDRLEDLVGAGYSHFYQSRLAEKNGYKDYVRHWMNESERLIKIEFSRDLRHAVKGVKDYDKVFAAVKQEYYPRDWSMRSIADNYVKHLFKVDKLSVELEDSDRDDFWRMVDDTYSKAKGESFKADPLQEKRKPVRGNEYDKYFKTDFDKE